ncbi:sulfotransferase [Iamia majanohamensis]|uniref:Sulfotransferase n=1 Tax=Iamia majanohamensis TaxID=467976 RepID=A0AAE9Y5S2_9ACTN|nr:sulfotransferase [Iamia majanohamensis]WCO67002.1 sulfotransferase [Iamia majanohamensis]
MDALDPEVLLAQAIDLTGLDDLGADGVREGLAVYTASLREEARLSELGEAALASTLVTALANRLRVVAWHRDHPEVAEEHVEAPLVVVGMFRAGTTLLSNLLDRDPANRSLLRWESLDSVPPSTPADHREGPRVDAARAGGEMLEALNPAMRAIHHEDADGPTECVAVMSQDMRSLSWEAIANVWSYGAWLRDADMEATYRYHRQVLQVLQSGGVRGRWALKSPHHALALDTLTVVYPDARLVMLHRDPVVLAASVCSLVSTLTGTFSDADHTAYIAEHWTRMLEDCVARTDAFRAAHPEHPIVDVRYADLVADPVGTVAALYRAVGDELSGPAADAMAALVAERPKGALGTHGYDLASHGLDEGALRERFAGYVERQAIPPEPVPG